LLLSRKTPERQAAKQVPIFLVQDARDGGEAPVLVRLVELGCQPASGLESGAKLLKLTLVLAREMDVRGMLVERSTVEIGVFDRCMSSLHGLLREREVAARDGVKVRLKVLRLDHDDLHGDGCIYSRVPPIRNPS
jgi:hypothetical protein